MRWPGYDDSCKPVIVSWETNMAKFIHIEISPSHIFRIKIDKTIKEKEEVS